MNQERISFFVTGLAYEVHGNVHFAVLLPQFFGNSLRAFAYAAVHLGCNRFSRGEMIKQSLLVRCPCRLFNGIHILIIW
jgi:hypothetical protein